MKLKVMFYIAFVIIMLMAFGCKGKAKQTADKQMSATELEESVSSGYGPSKKVVKEEFMKLWVQIHGVKDTGTNWKLINTEVGAIRADQKTKTAIVNIKFSYEPGPKPQRTKAADFSFREKDSFWEIDKETAKYPITP